MIDELNRAALRIARDFGDRAPARRSAVTNAVAAAPIDAAPGLLSAVGRHGSALPLRRLGALRRHKLVERRTIGARLE